MEHTAAHGTPEQPQHALVIHPDGTVVDTALNGSESRLAGMRRALHCQMIDCVSLTNQLDMWLDDEGLYTQHQNPAATVLARHFGLTHQVYYGPALICGFTAEGDSTGLTRDQLHALLTRLYGML